MYLDAVEWRSENCTRTGLAIELDLNQPYAGQDEPRVSYGLVKKPMFEHRNIPEV
jgi:hypothetical protein